MADSDFFKQFRKIYKPKKLDLTPYMKMPKLRGYKLLTDKTSLIPMKTYIKYIDKTQVFEGIHWNKDIKAGGILLKGGFYSNGKFKELKNPNEWTHLMLKFNPIYTNENDNDAIFEPKIYTIKIDKYHLFYKTFGRNIRDIFANWEVELV